MSKRKYPSSLLGKRQESEKETGCKQDAVFYFSLSPFKDQLGTRGCKSLKGSVEAGGCCAPCITPFAQETVAGGWHADLH